ncbi:peptidylprolyl isomerase [Phormidesmis priestleyi]
MVNLLGASIESDEVVDFLRSTIQLRAVCEKLLYQRIVNQTAQERGLVITSEEIQAEADRQRREKRLEKSADTLAWLNEQLITADDWEAGICNQQLSQKLAEFLFHSEAERFFAQNRLDFEQVVLYQIIVPYYTLAQELFYQIEEAEISFYEAAHLYDIDEQRRRQCGFEGVLYRWSLQPELAAVIFGANAGEIVRPVQTDRGYHLLMVEEFVSAQLTTETHQEIVQRLFQEWLESELSYLHNQAE